MIYHGHTNLQIAEELYISETTVKKHTHIYQKLDITGRKERKEINLRDNLYDRVYKEIEWTWCVILRTMSMLISKRIIYSSPHCIIFITLMKRHPFFHVELSKRLDNKKSKEVIDIE
ncbi:MAG: hypothetical protein GX306_10450 [Clostridiales bacterium]|nr:hypothetical protein [Clostridiales bacterium]